jgi:hypothetical protein
MTSDLTTDVCVCDEEVPRARVRRRARVLDRSRIDGLEPLTDQSIHSSGQCTGGGPSIMLLKAPRQQPRRRRRRLLPIFFPSSSLLLLLLLGSTTMLRGAATAAVASTGRRALHAPRRSMAGFLRPSALQPSPMRHLASVPSAGCSSASASHSRR